MILKKNCGYKELFDVIFEKFWRNFFKNVKRLKKFLENI